MTIDLRETGVTYQPASTATVRWYDLFGGFGAKVGDAVIWWTNEGEASGTVSATGWEFVPGPPTFWFDVEVKTFQDTPQPYEKVGNIR